MPTEEGLVAVPIEEFDVVMVDGQVMLLTEENPWARINIRSIERSPWWKFMNRGTGPDIPCPFTPQIA